MAETKRLFVTGLVITRDQTGTWVLSRVISNCGKFQIGEDENKDLNRDILQNFAGYVVEQVRPNIELFLEEELKQVGESDGHSTDPSTGSAP